MSKKNCVYLKDCRFTKSTAFSGPTSVQDPWPKRSKIGLNQGQGIFGPGPSLVVEEEEEEEELVFIPRFPPPYSSLKASDNRLPILSPQQTPCEAGGAESTPGKSSD